MKSIKDYKESAQPFEPKAFNIRGNPGNKKVLEAMVDKNNPEMFKNEGLALDYVFSVFEESKSASTDDVDLLKKIQGLQAELLQSMKREDNLREAFKQLQTKCQEVEYDYKKRLESRRLELAVERQMYQDAKKEIQRLEGELQDKHVSKAASDLNTGNRGLGPYFLANNEAYQKLKTDLERLLPRLYVKVYPQLQEIESVPISDSDVFSMMAEYCHQDPSKSFPVRERSEPIVKEFLKQLTNAQEETTHVPEGPTETTTETTENEQPTTRNDGNESNDTGADLGTGGDATDAV
jgi:vacuolar-type H+-ATPase subunit I/STV1